MGKPPQEQTLATIEGLTQERYLWDEEYVQLHNILIGAIVARAVMDCMGAHGHEIREVCDRYRDILERIQSVSGNGGPRPLTTMASYISEILTLLELMLSDTGEMGEVLEETGATHDT